MITIVGGTYKENCFEPSWSEIYGSGLRAAITIASRNSNMIIDFYTFGNSDVSRYLEQIKLQWKNINVNLIHTKYAISFFYEHPLSTPIIEPRPDIIDNNNDLNINASHVLYYGLLEGIPIVNADYLVYDPQSPVNPILFSKTGSKANHLAYILNKNEAQLLCKTDDQYLISKMLHDEENAEIVIIKDGARGAIISIKNHKTENVPVYVTRKVWPIGSGDVYAAIFAFSWFTSIDPFQKCN